MITEIKQPTEENTPIIPPVAKVRDVWFTTVPIKLYTSFLFLFMVVGTFLFSIRSNLPFSKDLVAPGFILCYVFAMQLNEHLVKRSVNNHN